MWSTLLNTADALVYSVAAPHNMQHVLPLLLYVFVLYRTTSSLSQVADRH